MTRYTAINRAQIVRIIIVDLRINERLQTGAVRKPHLPGDESVYLFLSFTIYEKETIDAVI